MKPKSDVKLDRIPEIGVRHGGTFVTTVEYLTKFYNINFAVGIDIMSCPSLTEYKKINSQVEFIKLNTQTNHFWDF